MRTKLTNAFNRLIQRPFSPITLPFNGFKWHFLRDIRQNKVVASMGFWLVFVPLAAKAMHEVTDVVSINLGGQIIKLHMALPFSWQSLFFAALVFSAGNWLVSFFCPSIVLEHKDFGSFESSGKTQSHLQKYDKQLDEQKRAELKPSKCTSYQEEEYTFLRNMFWWAYDIEDTSNPGLRWVCSTLYVIGFILITEILCKQILWVTSSMSLSAYLDQLVFWPALE